MLGLPVAFLLVQTLGESVSVPLHHYVVFVFKSAAVDSLWLQISLFTAASLVLLDADVYVSTNWCPFLR